MSEVTWPSGDDLVTAIKDLEGKPWSSNELLTNVLTGLQQKNAPEEVVISWLKGCQENIIFVGQSSQNLVDLLLKSIGWLKGKKFCKAYFKFVAYLLTSLPSLYTQTALKIYVSLFNEVCPEDGQVLYKLIDMTVRIVPMSKNLLFRELEIHFPYLKSPSDRQLRYVSHLLCLIDQHREHSTVLLNILINKLHELDLNCPRQQIEEEEEEEDDTPGMEIDGVDRVMRNPLMDTLDLLLNCLFEYISKACGTSDVEPHSPAMILFTHLLELFVNVILGCTGSTHIQFIMFNLCSSHKIFRELFLKEMWRIVQSPSALPKLRVNAACYMASLLARASFISLKICLQWMERFSVRLHKYINNHSDRVADSRAHTPFYALCQALFYLFVFRHREIVVSKTGLECIRRINFQSIITSSLNPLKVISPIVVSKFSTITRNYQICYCFTIIEHNERMFNTSRLENGMLQRIENETLQSFFPFDPYLLKRSSHYIKPFYQEYREQDEDDSRTTQGADNDDYDFLEEEKNSFPELFDYSKSPGFHIKLLDL